MTGGRHLVCVHPFETRTVNALAESSGKHFKSNLLARLQPKPLAVPLFASSSFAADVRRGGHATVEVKESGIVALLPTAFAQCTRVLR